MRRPTPTVRLLRAAALAVIIAGFGAHPVAAKVPYFTVDITPTSPVAGEPIQVVVRFWVDAGHTIAAPFEWERTMEDLIVMRPGLPGPEVPVALQLREPGRFEATVTLRAGEWTIVAFPDRTGWATVAVPVGYPDTIPLTVRESVSEPSDLVVPLVGLALVVLSGALRLRSALQFGAPCIAGYRSNLVGVPCYRGDPQPQEIRPMPTAIPAAAAAHLPPARMIDPRGHRFGAGVSAVALIVAALIGTPWVVASVLLSIGVSAAFGLRYSIYGVAWRRIARAAGLGKVEPEHEYPPRFAQVLGSVALTLALFAFAVGATTIGWVFVLAVAALQTVLAVTGYCLGCRLYFLRWWVPDFVTRLWTRGRVRRLTFEVDSIRYS